MLYVSILQQLLFLFTRYCSRTMCHSSKLFWLAFCRRSIYNERVDIYFRSGKSDFIIQIYLF